MNLKKKKEGFTLIELIITILIISTILGIAVSLITTTIRNANKKSKEISIDNLLDTAKIYTEEYQNEIVWQQNQDNFDLEKKQYNCVSINQLVNKGFLNNNDKKNIEKSTSANFVLVWKNDNNVITLEELDEAGLCKTIKNPINSEYCNQNLIYNGNEQKLIRDNIKHIDISGQTTGTMFGDYSITLTPKQGYFWEDGSIESKNITCTIKAPVYTINYNGNGHTNGSTVSSTHECGTSQNLTANGFTKTGYTFTEWNTKIDGSGTSYTDKQSVINLTYTNNEVITLYAQWKVNTYKVYYNGNGYTSQNYDNTSICDDNEKCGLEQYSTGSEFDTSTGIFKHSKNYYYDTSLNLIYNRYERLGYVFNGWNTKSDGSGTLYANEATVKNLTPINKDVVTLYANWTPNKIYVTYNTNGGNFSSNNTAYTKDSNNNILINGSNIGDTYDYTSENINLHNYNNKDYIYITKTGYKALSSKEWNTKKDGTGKSFSQNTDEVSYAKDLCDATKSDCSITLYVNWTPNKYTVTFNPNGGSVSKTSQSVTYNSTYGTLPSPTRSNYNFTGWYTATSGGTKITSTTKVTITKNQTLYARWAKKSGNVELCGQCSSNSQCANGMICSSQACSGYSCCVVQNNQTQASMCN